MATCPRCRAPLRPGAPACHVCGLAVGAPPAGVTASPPRGTPRRLRWIVAGCAVGVVAALALWFLALRGPVTSGDEFLGTWRARSMQGSGSATVTRGGEGFDVLLAAGETAGQARVVAHLDGDRLVLTPGDFSASGDPNAERLGLALKLVAGDFRIELSGVGPSRILLRMTGTSPADRQVDERTVLEKAGASPAPS